MKLEVMEPMSVKDGEFGVRKNEDGFINPFLQDLSNMGTQLGKNVMIMHANHDTQICDHLIIVNLKTGERQKLIISDEEIDEDSASIVKFCRDHKVDE